MKIILILLLSCFCMAAVNTNYDVSNISLMDKNKVEFMGIGVASLVAAGETSTIDYELPDDVFLTGAKMKATGACDDDRIKVQIVFGTTMVNQFIDWWSMDMDTELPIPAKIPKTHPTLGQGKIRAIYQNTCTMPVKVRVNYHLYKIKD